jgi:hypothetical protein
MEDREERTLGCSRRARPLNTPPRSWSQPSGHVAHPIRSIQFFAADTAATTAIQLMHRKRLMIGKFPDDARWRADDAMASALITCHDE